MAEEEVNDIQQARLIISLKNDEINSLLNKMKMVDKKTSIKVSEVNYQLQQEKNKIIDLQRKIQRMKVQSQSQLLKKTQLQSKIKEQTQKNKQVIHQLSKKQKSNEKSLKNHIHQLQISLESIKIENNNLKKELKELHKIFPLKQLLQQYNCTSVQQLTPYFKLKQQLKEKEDQVQQLYRKMDAQKSQTLLALEDSFGRVSSYEEVMIQLHSKNSQLQAIAQQKAQLYEIKNRELEQTANMMNQVAELNNQKIEQLNTELQYLRTSVKNYERQSINYRQNQTQNQKNLQFIFELTTQFQQKQSNFIRAIQQLEQQLQTKQKDRQAQIQHYHKEINQLKDMISVCQQKIIRQKKNLQERQFYVQMLKNNIQTLELQLQSERQQLARNKSQISDLLKRKHKMEEDFSERQNFFKTKQQSLLEQIDLLRMSASNKYQQQQIDYRNSSSLAQQINNSPDINWYEMYQNSLRRNNEFVKEVYFMLTKEPRLSRDNQQANSRKGSLWVS